MIKTVLINHKTGEFETGGQELFEKWKGTNLLLWIDMQNGGSDEQAIFDVLKIHPLAVKDATRKRHPPKYERFDNFDLIMMRGLDASYSGEGLEFRSIQLSLMVGKNWIITRHADTSTSVNYVNEQITSGQLQAKDGNAIAVAIMARLIRRYVEMLLEFEPRLEEIEDEMFIHPDDALLAELTNHKGRLREILRIAQYHQLVVGEVREQHMADDYVHETASLAEQVNRTFTLASMYYDTSKDLTDSYLALASHNLNRVMQVLTVITVIFVPLTFIAGIYGMNFEYIPELGYRAGYFIVIGLMVVLAASLLIVFKRKRWF